MKVGRRLAIKLLNASKFALGMGVDTDALDQPVTEALDRALVMRLSRLVEECTEAFDGYDYARALERTESQFWAFTDDYIELVKNRAYGQATVASAAGTASAHATLAITLDALLRLLAPFLPFATEEVWSWWREGSIHHAPWPDPAALLAKAGVDADPEVLTVAGMALTELRRPKTEAKRSLKTKISHAAFTAAEADRDRLDAALPDLTDSALIEAIDIHIAEPEGGGRIAVTVTLEPEA